LSSLTIIVNIVLAFIRMLRNSILSISAI